MIAGIPINRLYLLALVLLISLASCSVERKFGREYVSNDSTRSALFIPPDLIYKISLKDWEIDSASALSEWELDSMLWERSLFLQYISDSIFLDYYVGNFISQLENLGFEVFPEDSLMNFLSGENDAYIIHLAQLEIEEYVFPFEESEQFGEYIYTEVIDLNAINVNSWYEISQVNEEDKSMFFSSHYLIDDMEGFFKYYPFTGDVVFKYEVDTLMMDQVYRLAALAGYLYAGYTFDFLLNRYIDKRMEEEGYNRSQVYYHYNRRKNYFSATKEEDRFIPLN